MSTQAPCFWIVTRTSDPGEINLDLENMTWEQQIKVNFTGPGLKKRKLAPVEWSPIRAPVPADPSEPEGNQEAHQNSVCSWPRRKRTTRPSIEDLQQGVLWYM